MRAIYRPPLVAVILANLLTHVIGSGSGSEKGMHCEDGICTRISDEPRTNICIDTDANCRQYAADGECDHNPTFMHRSCANACRVCPSFACADEHELCADWATAGECENNPNYMLHHCSLSCGVCHEGDNEEMRGMVTHSECKDSLDECPRFVSRGMCVSSHIFMMNNCPMACHLCDTLETFDRCIGKRHTLLKPIFAKAAYSAEENIRTTDVFFETIKTDEKSIVITQPSKSTTEDEPAPAPAQSTNDPYIIQINDMFSPEQCDHLIQISNSIGWEESTVNANDYPHLQLPVRSSMSIQCDQSHKEFKATVSDMVQVLAEKTGIPTANFEADEIVHYPPGGYYSSHHNHRLGDEYIPAGTRVLSMYIILSDAKRSASVGFPGLDWLLVNPNSVGSVLLWPNVDNDLNVDARMNHEIMPVKGGDLYLLQMHVHLYDYEKSAEIGCA